MFCGTYIDGLEGVLNLIDSSLRGESVDTTIVVLLAIEKNGVIKQNERVLLTIPFA